MTLSFPFYLKLCAKQGILQAYNLISSKHEHSHKKDIENTQYSTPLS